MIASLATEERTYTFEECVRPAELLRPTDSAKFLAKFFGRRGMAIYHFSAKMIKRSSGHSVTAHAAYCAHAKIADSRTGEIHDYRPRSAKDKLQFSEIIAPENAPDFCFERSLLWNAAEMVEKRKDAQVARSIVMALPGELNAEQKSDLVRDFCRTQFADDGMVADACIHEMDGHNPHAHVILTTRELTPEGFGKKNRTWNDKAKLEGWRSAWATHANDALKAAGIDEKIDHRSYAEQGLDIVPTVHLGKTVTQMMKKSDQPRPFRAALNDLINERNRVAGKAAAMSIEKPTFAFDPRTTEIANLTDTLNIYATPQQMIEEMEKHPTIAQSSKTFETLVAVSFEKSAQQRIQHTIDLSLHRTKRRVLKRADKALINESKALTARLSKPEPLRTAEIQISKTNVFATLKDQLASAGRSIWDALKKPFLKPQEKIPDTGKSLFGTQRPNPLAEYTKENTPERPSESHRDIFKP